MHLLTPLSSREGDSERPTQAARGSSAQFRQRLSRAMGTESLFPLPALSMACGESEVRRRIREVLNEKKNRGAVGTATLVLCAAGVTATAIPGAVLALRFESPVSAKASRPAGQTAGTADNAFRARLTDGREVELVQVSRSTPHGVQSWRPDGTLLNAKDAIPTTFGTFKLQSSSGPNAPKGEITPYKFFFRVEPKAGASSVEVGMSSGPREAGNPTWLSSAAITALPADGSAKRIFVSQMLMSGLGNGKYSFGFSVADDAFETPLTVQFDPQGKFSFIGQRGHATIGDDGRIDIDPFKNVDVAHPAKMLEGLTIHRPNGEKTNLDAQATSLELAAGGGNELRAVAYDRSGKPVAANLVEVKADPNGLKRRWNFRRKPQELKGIEVRMRPYYVTEFREVPLLPRGASNP